MLLFYFTKAKSKIQEATLRFNTNHSPTRCFSSFPHIVSARHISPSVYNCFRNAEVVWFFFFFLPRLHEKEKFSGSPDIQLPASISGTLRLVLFIWHLSSCFISAWSLFPLSSLTIQRLRPGADWLLLHTNLSFSLSLSPSSSTQNVGEIFFFSKQKQNSFRSLRGKKKPWTRKWYLCWHGEFPAPEVWGTTQWTVLWKWRRVGTWWSRYTTVWMLSWWKFLGELRRSCCYRFALCVSVTLSGNN